MKNAVRLFGTLGLKLCVVVFFAALCIGMAACDNGTTSSGGNGEETPGKAVDLISVEAVGTPTRSLTLKFSADIENLSKEDIIFNPKGVDALVTAVALTGSGTNRSLEVTPIKAGKLTVSVSKDGYRVAGAKTVDVVLAPPEWERVTLVSAAANGSLGADGKAAVTTSKLTFELGKAIPGLTAENVIVDAGVRKGLLEKIGDASYSVNISGFGVDADTGVGTLNVKIDKVGYVVEPSIDVTVYVYKRPASGTGTPVGYTASTLEDVHTTSITLTFGQVVPGLSAENVVLSVVPGSGDGNVIRGVLSQPRIIDGKAEYTLWIDGVFDYGISVLVDVVKDGYSFNAEPLGSDVVMLYYYRESDFSVVADGVKDMEATKTLTLMFSDDPGLAEDKVQITGSSTVSGGRVTSFDNEGSGVYKVGIAGFAKDGEVTVKPTMPGFIFKPATQTVSIYYIAKPVKSITELIDFLRSVNAGENVTIKIDEPMDLRGVKDAIQEVIIGDKKLKITIDIAENSKVRSIGGTYGGSTWPDLSDCPNLYGVVLGQYVRNIDATAFTISPSPSLREIILDAPLYLGTGNTGGTLNSTTGLLGIQGLKVIINADQTEAIFSGASVPTLEFGEGINTITKNLFSGVTGPAALTLPAQIKNVAVGAFSTSATVTSLVIEGALESLSDSTTTPTWPSGLNAVTFKKSPVPSNAVLFPATVTTVTLEDDATVVPANFAVSSSVAAGAVENLTLNGTASPVLGGFAKLKALTINEKFMGDLTGSDFNGLAELLTITVGSTNTKYKSPSNVLISYDEKTLIKYPQKMVGTSYTVPTSITTIGESAFKGNTTINASTYVTLSNATKIEDNAFEGATGIAAVVIPTSVGSIGNEAFKGCSALATLTFTGTSTVKSIGVSAFEGTKLSAISIPESVTSLGESAFKDSVPASGNSTLTIAAGSGLTSIPAKAFMGNTKLNSVTINSTTKITSIGASAFEDCDELTAFSLPATATPVGDVSIGDSAFASGIAGITSITIGGKLVAIGDGALPAGCINVDVSQPVGSSVQFPSSVTNVILSNSGSVAATNFSSMIGVTITLNGSSKQALTDLKDSVTSIGFGASFSVSPNLTGSDFDALTKLNEIVVSGGSTYAATDGVLFNFAEDSLIRYPIAKTGDEYTVPVTVTSIASGSFKNVKYLKKLDLTSSTPLTNIADGAFIGCLLLKEVDLSNSDDTDNFTGIGTATMPGSAPFPVGAFADVTTLETVTGLAGVIGVNTFKGCTGLAAPAFTNVTAIGESAFEGCTAASSSTPSFAGFATVAIPATTLTTIGKNAFKNCSNLKTLTFATSSGVTTIGEGAFYGTDLDAAVNFNGAPLTSGIGVTPMPTNGTIPVGPFEGTKITSVTGFGTGAIIGANAFRNCANLTTPTLTNVTSIVEGAFAGCNAAGFNGPLTIPITVGSIGKNAFNGCTNLGGALTVTGTTSTLATIGDGAFYGTKITSLVFNDAPLTSIGTIPSSGSVSQGAFEGITDLATITWSTDNAAGLTIGARAFYGCTGLTALSFAAPAGATSFTIGASAFEGCSNTNFAALVIPATVTGIGNRAFYGCTSLATLTLAGLPVGTGNSSLGNDAFGGITNLKSLVLTGTVLTSSNAPKLPIGGFETVTLTADQGGFSFSGFTSLKNVIVNGTAAVTVYNANFTGMDTIEEVSFATDFAHVVQASAFTSTALKTVKFTSAMVATVNIISVNSFPWVQLEVFEATYFMSFKEAYAAGGAAAISTYDLDREKGWKKSTP
jgi:hypothetical protein